MTREEAKKIVHSVFLNYLPFDGDKKADEVIEALKHEPCEDEIILIKEEYGQLLSNEFDNGYAKGYREALEQDSVLGKIKADIAMYEADCRLSGDEEPCKQCTDNVFGSIYRIIDKYKAGE